MRRFLPLVLLASASAASGQANEQRWFSPVAGSTTQRCGEALASDGDLLVAGAPYNDENGSDSGCVFVFRFDAASDSWVEEQQLFASDPESIARFGSSVAIDDDLIVVGAPLKNTSSTSVDFGAVYVFRFDATAGAWSEEQKLLASNAAAGDKFGSAVGVHAASDLIVVGAAEADTPAGSGSGTAYVYRYKDSTVKWIEEIELVDPNGAASDRAGSAVATDGTTLVVAAPFDDVATKVDAGTIEVWDFDGANWSSVQELGQASPSAIDRFGTSIALRGDLIAVGAPLENSTGVTDSGAAYLFERVAGTWSLLDRFDPLSPDVGAQFGNHVALGDDVLLVGSSLDDPNGVNDSGSAATFRFNPRRHEWFPDQRLGASDATTSDRFGTRVAICAGQFVVAAPLNNTTAGSDWGALYGFDEREIVLEIDPPVPLPDETIVFSAYRGDPGDPVMITIEDVAGTPMFLPVIVFTFQSDHALGFSADAPNPLYGVHVGMRAYKISATGPVVFSELAYVDV